MRTILQTSFIKTATVLTMIALAGMATDPVQAAKKRPAKSRAFCFSAFIIQALCQR